MPAGRGGSGEGFRLGIGLRRTRRPPPLPAADRPDVPAALRSCGQMYYTDPRSANDFESRGAVSAPGARDAGHLAQLADPVGGAGVGPEQAADEIGRASCRASVCEYV